MKKLTIAILTTLIFLSASRVGLALYIPNESPPVGGYVPNELIVKFKSPTQTPEALQQAATQLAHKKDGSLKERMEYFYTLFELKARNTPLPQDQIARIKNVEQRSKVRTTRKLFQFPTSGASSNTLGASDEALSTFRLIKTTGEVPLENVYKNYQTLPEVESVEYNQIYHIFETPNDELFGQMWHLKTIQAEETWNITKGSDEITVAVIDTGADYNHADLKDHLLSGRDFTGLSQDAQDDNGHGTHVSGTIGAVTNNTSGVAGINWNVKILPLKALGGSAGTGPATGIMEAISYAAQQADAQHIKVVNMSLGGSGRCPYSYQQAIQSAINAGVSVVAAAGNDNADASNSAPANCPGVITVGATGSTDQKASFSNYGSILTLSAPGVGILSTIWPGNGFARYGCPGKSYCAVSGTSQATPNVAGVVALMYAVKPNMTPAEAKQILSNPANLDPVSTQGVRMGAGRLNALKAVQAAGGVVQPTNTPTPINPPTATLTPTGVGGGAPTFTPTPTGDTPPTPTPTTIGYVPLPPLYSCTAKVFPQIGTSDGCTCSTGICTTQCQFYENPTQAQTTVNVLGESSSRILAQKYQACPDDSQCVRGSQCIPFNRIVPGVSCGFASLCCLAGTPTLTPTLTPTGIGRSDPAFTPTPTGVNDPPSGMSCRGNDPAGQDKLTYCRRPLRTAGDANGDGTVDFTDYFYLKRALLQASNPSEVNVDFNGDGKVDNTDKAIILQSLKSLCY